MQRQVRTPSLAPNSWATAPRCRSKNNWAVGNILSGGVSGFDKSMVISASFTAFFDKRSQYPRKSGPLIGKWPRNSQGKEKVKFVRDQDLARDQSKNYPTDAAILRECHLQVGCSNYGAVKIMLTRRNGVIASATLIGVIAVLVFEFWDYDLQETRRVMLAATHSCPAGTVEKIERAGEVGWLRFCANGEIRQGPFAYWKKQRKYAEGYFAEGRQVGKAIYFDETGKVTRVDEWPK
jgi:hypothetical protein